MGWGRGRARCTLWGGIALGVGTVAFALFSPSSAGCSTSIVVLTHSTVTARGCAAYSVIAHVGIGCMVLGAVLLLGSFALAARSRRQPTAVRSPSAVVGSATTSNSSVSGVDATIVRRPETPRQRIGSGRPTPPVKVDAPDDPHAEPVVGVGPLGSAVQLPPGWYGNPNAPGKPVQWWDGTKLTDRPGD